MQEKQSQEQPFVNVKRDQLVYILALIVAGVWAIVSLVSLLIGDYTGLTIVTPVMVIVAGFVFGFKRNGNANGNH